MVTRPEPDSKGKVVFTHGFTVELKSSPETEPLRVFQCSKSSEGKYLVEISTDFRDGLAPVITSIWMTQAMFQLMYDGFVMAGTRMREFKLPTEAPNTADKIVDKAPARKTTKKKAS